jgi:hypothetical protein
MRAGTGKIARLPREVRDELNRRLDDGEEGAALLHWLNGRPGTLKAMQDRFAGQPVSKQNLSDWRQGGHLEWQRQQEALDLAGRLLEDAEDVEKLATDGPLADRLAELVAVSLGHLLQAATRLPDGPEKTGAVLKSARELIRLRRADRDYERAQRERKDWQRKQEEQEKCDLENAEQERKDRLLAPIRLTERRQILGLAYSMDGRGEEAARKTAWFQAGVEFDLPESEWTPPPKPAPVPACGKPRALRRSNRVERAGAGQGESSPVKAGQSQSSILKVPRQPNPDDPPLEPHPD